MRQTKQHIRGGYQDAQRHYDIDPGVQLTVEGMEEFLLACQKEGRTDTTLEWYRRGLKYLYDYLPEEKTIHYGTLERWRESLLEKGYAPGTVNTFLSVNNSYLDFLGHREYQVADQLKLRAESRPELNREEYLRLLATARALGQERVYLLVKLFGTTGLNVKELPKLTVEAVKAGRLVIDGSRSEQIIRIPEGLQKELLDFIKRIGTTSGPVFLTREGKPMNRAYVTRMTRRLCTAAKVSEEKGNPRGLRRLYQSTRAGIENEISLLVEQAHDRLLAQEQLTIGWEGRTSAE